MLFLGDEDSDSSPPDLEGNSSDFDYAGSELSSGISPSNYGREMQSSYQVS